MLLSSLSVVVGLASVVAAVHDATHQLDVRHKAHANRAAHNATTKRDSFSGQATYFEVGMGSCGQMSVDSDFMVALNTPQYGAGYPGPNCFKPITISAFGKTQNAVIMDECPSCAWGSLDMSPGLFGAFTDLGAGVFPITWWFNDGSNNNPGGGQTTTSTKQWVPPSTTSTSTYHTTTSTTSSTPTPTPTPTPTTTSAASSTTEASSTTSGTIADTASSSAVTSSASGSWSDGNNDSQGGGIPAQQRLVANFGYMVAKGRGSQSS